jgi:glyceraldehyde-3-phosphate dehydrogenase/erythrose-4-phosphate dehydrogenase
VTSDSENRVRAAVPRKAVEIIAGRAPDADVVAIEDHDRLDGFAFLVPLPDRPAELVEVIGRRRRVRRGRA